MVEIGPMLLDDLDGVLAVEAQSFLTPWSRQAFVGELTENPYAYYRVARSEGVVIGYGGAWFFLGEAHVTNVAVAPSWRGKGVGRALMEALMAAAQLAGAQRMTLEVRASNEVALAMYKSLGFTEAGVRKGYYTDYKEDAIIMWKDPL